MDRSLKVYELVYQDIKGNTFKGEVMSFLRIEDWIKINKVKLINLRGWYEITTANALLRKAVDVVQMDMPKSGIRRLTDGLVETLAKIGGV